MNIFSSICSENVANKTQYTCDRCGGTGYLPQYRHIERGICFKCRGAKVVTRYQRIPIALLKIQK